jgi:acetylornithine deacetylase/succinyl-diaminopimelate desuccinylase-like protein
MRTCSSGNYGRQNARRCRIAGNGGLAGLSVPRRFEETLMNILGQTKEELLNGLIEFLRIPSISTSPENRPAVVRAAEFVANELRLAGMQNVHLINAEGRHPLVYGEWLGAPGKPTLLLYGHYDVQPPDPLEEWETPPFEPSVRNDNLYARGACDDKGQTYILVRAVRGLMQTEGKLPVNVRFLIEGEEEVGGEHIEEYVGSKPANLKADAAIICDTEMFAPELPTLCVGLRGIIYGDIVVEGSKIDLHSGVYGGAAPNPVQAVAEILCALKDRDGHILIPGYYDDVVPPSPLERQAWARLPFDEKEYLEKEMFSKELVGEPEIGLFERLWARPTIEVHGIRGGFTGEGAKTVIPARAVAKVSSRLVANQDPVKSVEMLKKAIAAATPRGVTAEFKVIHAAAPSMVDPNNPFIRAAAGALTEVFGKETVFIRSGGSIPIVGVFLKSLGIPSVLMGFGLPDDRLHSPNEKFHLPNFYRGIETVAHYFRSLGRQ